MTVNGIPVEGYSPFGGNRPSEHGCVFLKNSAGGHEWMPNDQGRYELGAKTLHAEDHVRLVSIVIW